MARGRKPSNSNTLATWDDIFWKNLPTYITILNNYLNSVGFASIEVVNILDKISFKIPKGLTSKEIKSQGNYPVISQSKEFTIGYSDKTELLVKSDFPLILFGDHSKTIKYVEEPFIIGADGVKILKSKKDFDDKFLYYFLHGVITDTKDYGRHYSLLRKGSIANVNDIQLQKKVVLFLDNLKTNTLNSGAWYFDEKIEFKILNLQLNQIDQIEISSELINQLSLVKQLRQAFLSEAMQGKLICQSELPEKSGQVVKDQETGQQLLDRIKAEKAQVIKDKKLKKYKELPPIKPEDIPFEIPEDWVWCRLGDLLNIKSGKRIHAADYRIIGVPFLRSGEIGSLGRGENLKTELFISKTKYQEIKSKFGIPKSGDILIACIGGSIGNTWLVDEREFYFKDGNLVLIESISLINNCFVLYYLKSSFFWKNTILNATDSSYNALTIIKLNDAEFPLPPLKIQNQIVAKLDELMKNCDDLENNIKQSQIQNEQLLQQVLKEALEVREEIV